MATKTTGHSQGDVEAALRQGAPGIRPPSEVRDWNDYAQRAASYVYSSAGERQVRDLQKYRERWERWERWERLEGRAPVLERAPDRETKKQIEQKRQRGPRLGM